MQNIKTFPNLNYMYIILNTCNLAITEDHDQSTYLDQDLELCV